jgi:hypothetical protein
MGRIGAPGYIVLALVGLNLFLGGVLVAQLFLER